MIMNSEEQYFISSQGPSQKHLIQENSPLYKGAKNGMQQHPFTTSPAPLSQQRKEPPMGHQALIDWVNSFNDPYCLLVNGASDLVDGIALCHLVGFITCSLEDQQKIKELVYYDASSKNQELSLQNIDLAVNILHSSNMPLPPEIKALTPQHLLIDDHMLTFLKNLKQLHEILSYRQPGPSAKLIEEKQSYTPHYTSQNNVLEDQKQTTQQKNYTQPVQIPQVLQAPQLTTPRTAGSASDARNSQTQSDHTQKQEGSNQKQVYQAKYHQNLDSQKRGQSAQQFSQLKEATISADIQSFKENTQPFQQTQYSAIAPFQQHSQQKQNDFKRFEQSFDLNAISPIGQRKKLAKQADEYNSHTPTRDSQRKSLNHDVSNQSIPPSKVPRVNVQVAVQQQQFQLIETEEQQLERDLHALNQSYKKSITKVDHRSEERSYNQVRGSQQQRSGSKVSSSQGSRVKKTSSQEQKERLRQMQLDLSDYQNILRGAHQSLIKHKELEEEAYTLEPPQSFMIESRCQAHQQRLPQILSERMPETQTKHKFTNVSRHDDQKSIRFQVEDNSTARATDLNQRIGITSNLDNEDIMSEMQTLHVRPESKEGTKGSSQGRTLIFNDIQIQTVEPKTKARLLEWLSMDVKIIKNNQRLIDELPLYCKNGVFLCDLANRLSSRTNTIKGVDRNPKNLTHILNNFNRVLDYLRSYPRFCPRYLWAHKYLMDGNPDVLWGLLDDIYHWHFNKISPNDPGHERNMLSSQSPQQKERTLSPQQNQSPQRQQIAQYKATLPPKQHTKRQDPNASMNVMRVINKTPLSAAEGMRPDSSQVLGRSGSYSQLHNQQRTPQRKTPQQKTPQKSAIKNCGGLLQLQESAKKEDNSTYNQPSARSVAQNMSAQKRKHSSSKRRGASACTSPIAKDSMGNYYYFQQQDGERNSAGLFQTNKPNFNVHQHIPISQEMEGELRNWLFSLKFGEYLSREFEYRDICHDPFCNGILFAEVFSYLDKVTVLKLNLSPSTIAESRANVKKVLSLISQRRGDFPLRLLNDESVEKVLKRDRQTLYEIFYFLKQSYPDVKPPAQAMFNRIPSSKVLSNVTDAQQQNLQMPYSQSELKLLEISLLNWLRKLGVLTRMYGLTSRIQSFIDLQKDISNGLILSELVGTIFNLKITGIFKDPKTEATMISNLRKSLEVLRRQSKMSQKYTWTERELFEGRVAIFIGLLEDLHRCFDGLPPRKRGLNYFADGPYLGDTLYDEREVEIPQTQSVKTLVKEEAVRLQVELVKRIDGLVESGKYQELPSIFNNHKYLISSEEGTFKSQNVERPLLQRLSQSPDENGGQVILKPATTSANFATFLNKKLQRENCSPLRIKEPPHLLQQNMLADYLKPSVSVTDVAQASNSNSRAILITNAGQDQQQPPKHHFQREQQLDMPLQQQEPASFGSLEAQKRELQEQYPVAPTRSPLNINGRCQSFEFDLRSNLKKPTQISMSDYENDEHNLNRYAYNIKEKAKIVEWLQTLGVQLPKHFNLEVEPIIYLRDGILLADIIGTLEGAKIENISQNPKTHASCLQNIKKALQVLKKKNQVPLYLLYSDEEIYNGNGEIIFQLLKSLRQAYKNKPRSLSKGRKSQHTATTMASLPLGTGAFSNV